MVAMWLLACAPQDSDVDLGEVPAELPLPDLSGIDFAAAVEDAVQASKTVAVGPAWAAHASLLSGRRAVDCPDLWVGAPDDESVDLDAEGGSSWFDHCSAGATDFDGWAWFDTALVASGDAASPEGLTVDATRELSADGVISDDAGVQLELDGEFSDAVSRTDAPDYQRWTWSSAVAGTVTGAEAMDGSRTPGGWRADLAVYASGPDENVYEVAGNIFLFDSLWQGRFDSADLDLAFAGAGAAGPDDCSAEPAGWIGLRDENAYWYDLVFQPRHSDTGTVGGACDGCGELYVRGVGTDLGEVCVDFSFLWSEEPVSPPEAEDYVLSLHSLEGP